MKQGCLLYSGAICNIKRFLANLSSFPVFYFDVGEICVITQQQFCIAVLHLVLGQHVVLPSFYACVNSETHCNCNLFAISCSNRLVIWFACAQVCPSINVCCKLFRDCWSICSNMYKPDNIMCFFLSWIAQKSTKPETQVVCNQAIQVSHYLFNIQMCMHEPKVKIWLLVSCFNVSTYGRELSSRVFSPWCSKPTQLLWNFSCTPFIFL